MKIKNGIWIGLILIVTLFIIYYFHNQNKEKFTNSLKEPQVYYINLDKATERNERFIKNNKHLKLNRIKAISPENYEQFNVIKPEHCINNTLLEMCCSMSHLKAMHTAYHSGSDIALIMEDDMYFLKNPNWKELIQSAPSDWDVLQLYTFDTNVYNVKHANWVKFENHMFSCGAYVMNKRSLEKILKKFIPDYNNPNWDQIKTIDFKESISVCAADFFIYQNMITYVHTQILLNEEGYDSYLHPDHLPMHRRSINQINNMFKN